MSELTNCIHFEYLTNENYHDMNGRYKIEPKLIVQPSMQIFKVDEQAASNDQPPIIEGNHHRVDEIQDLKAKEGNLSQAIDELKAKIDVLNNQENDLKQIHQEQI